jgi:hypothetical protein
LFYIFTDIKLLDIVILIKYLSVFLALLPIGYYLIYAKKIGSVKFLSLYLLLAILTDILITPASSYLFGSQFWGIKIFTFFEFLFLSLFYYPRIQLENKKYLYAFFTVLFLSVFLYENIVNKDTGFDSYSIGVSAITILIYSIVHLFGKISNNRVVFNIDGEFIICFALILYFSGTFFIYILSKNNFNYSDFQGYYDLINPVILIIRNILLLLALVRINQNKNQGDTSTYNLKHA